MANQQFFVYILTNKYNTVLYTGVTNNLSRRLQEHALGLGSKYTSKYRTHKLVYYEVTESIEVAIRREKQIKAGSRKKKIDLIVAMNPEWRDLSDDL